MVVKPVINGSSGTWGSILNTALDSLQADADASVKSAVVTTKGDLLAATASATLARVPVGVNGQALLADSTAGNGVTFADVRHPVYTAAGKPTAVAGGHLLESDTGYEQVGRTIAGTPTWTPEIGSPVFRLVQTAAQSIPNNTGTPILWGSAVSDRLSGFSSGGDKTRYTCQLPGVYDLSGAVGFASNATGYRNALIYLNGSPVTAGGVQINAGTSSMVVPIRNLWVQLVAGDFLQVYVQHTAGGPLDTQTGSLAAHLQARYLGVNAA